MLFGYMDPQGQGFLFYNGSIGFWPSVYLEPRVYLDPIKPSFLGFPIMISLVKSLKKDAIWGSSRVQTLSGCRVSGCRVWSLGSQGCRFLFSRSWFTVNSQANKPRDTLRVSGPCDRNDPVVYLQCPDYCVLHRQIIATLLSRPFIGATAQGLSIQDKLIFLKNECRVLTRTLEHRSPSTSQRALP